MSYCDVADPAVDDHRDVQLRGQMYIGVLKRVHQLASGLHEKRSADEAESKTPQQHELPEDPVKTIRVSCVRSWRSCGPW